MGVAFMPKGQRIASAGGDGTMRLWDAGTGAPLNPNPAHFAPLNSVAISPDGRKLVTAGLDGNIEIWDPGSGQLLAISRLFPEGTAVDDVRFDRGGNLCAASGQDGSIKIVDTTNSHRQLPIIKVAPLVPGTSPLAGYCRNPVER